MEVAIIIVVIMIPITLFNQMMMRKALLYLKPEHKKKEFLISFNFLWPKRDYFYPEGWKLWVRLRWIGLIEVAIFMITLYLLLTLR